MSTLGYLFEDVSMLFPIPMGSEISTSQEINQRELEALWPDLPDTTKQDLLDKLEHDRDNHDIYAYITLLSSMQAIHNALQKKVKKRKTPPPSRKMVACPRDFARIRPFLPQRIPSTRYSTEKPSMVIHERKEHTTSWGTIAYQGPPIYTADEDLLLHLLFTSDSEAKVQCNFYQIAIDFAEKDNGDIYRFIRKSIECLLETKVEISATGGRQYAAFHILESVAYDEESEKMIIKINKWFKDMYAEKLTSRVDLNIRKSLSEAGKAIYTFLCSHNNHEWWGTWDQLAETTRVGEGQRVGRRRQFIKEAIAALADKGLIHFKEKSQGKAVFFKLKA